MSFGFWCLAASKRKPSTPSEMRSFPYAASLARTYSVSVARLKSSWSTGSIYGELLTLQGR
jgi:hypothetical protein